MKGFVIGVLSLLALILTPLASLEAQTKKVDFAKLRAENVLAVNMSDKVIAFYLDPKQWPETISPAQKVDYIQECLNLRIVHVNAFLTPIIMLPFGPNEGSWYHSRLVNLDNYRLASYSSHSMQFGRGSMYNPIYINAVLPYQPGGNWSSSMQNTGISYNGIRF